MVLVQKNCFDTKSALIDAIIADVKLKVKVLCASSKANITPDSGALNAADNPALAPLVIKYFSSLSKFF